MDQGVAHQVFFEIHSDLPREGPGSNEATSKAFSLLPQLCEKPKILDLGCGPGMQTIQLANLVDGDITAVDIHQPYLDELQRRVNAEGLGDRVTPLRADIYDLPFSPNSFDLIWAEGSAYILKFGSALRGWRSLLKSPGYLVVSEISWIQPDPPQPAVNFWNLEYPEMQSVEENLSLIKRMGYIPIAHYLLPQEAWWEHYYSPIETRLRSLKNQYSENADALQVLKLHQQEIDIYRQYSDYYGYVFYVLTTV